MTSSTCLTCKESFSYEPIMFNGKEFARPSYCQKCTETANREQLVEDSKRVHGNRLSRLRIEMPAIFWETDISKLPPEAIQALKWQYNPKGLLLMGPTGSTKTRTLWKLIQMLYLGNGYSFEFTSEIDLALRLTSKVWSDYYEATLRKFTEVKILVIDDLGKAKYTGRVQEALFHIVNARTENGLPMLLSTQFSGSELVDKWSTEGGQPAEQGARERNAETAQAWIRRIREFCQVIEFKERKK